MAIKALCDYADVQNGNHEFAVLPDELPAQNQATSSQLRVVPKLPGPENRQAALSLPAPAPASLPKPGAPDISLNSLVERFRADSGHLAVATRQKFDFHFKVAARYLDFSRAVSRIKLADMRELKSKLSEGRKPSTVNDIIFKALGALFDMATDDGLIERSPLERLKRVKLREPDRKEVTWEKVQQLTTEVGRYAQETAIILGFMQNFGVGQAEIKHLQGEHVDVENGMIHFRRKKTGKPFGVPIFPHAKVFVEKLKTKGRFQVGKPVVEWRNPRKALESACERLNLARCEPRAFRRCFIVHALETGIDPRLVARWQGHKDTNLIFKVYGKHIDLQHEKRQAEKLGSLPDESISKASVPKASVPKASVPKPEQSLG
jgi:integrase